MLPKSSPENRLRLLLTYRFSTKESLRQPPGGGHTGEIVNMKMSTVGTNPPRVENYCAFLIVVVLSFKKDQNKMSENKMTCAVFLQFMF